MQERKDLLLLFEFNQAVFLAEMAGPGCGVQLSQPNARAILERWFDLERAFDEMMVCYMEAEDECAKLKAAVYYDEWSQQDVSHLPPL